MRWTETVWFTALFSASLAFSAAPVEAGEARRVASSGPLTPAFQKIAEGDVVALDLHLAPEPALLAQFAAAGSDGLAEEPGAELTNCPFGALEPLSEVVDLPTGDNHFLLSLRLGDPDQHAANLASCEYQLSEEGPGAFLRLRGCYLALELAIPTARRLLLNPLPSAECRGAK